ncbi:MAG: T9SS type A sorting domain-containing protein [Salinivirgaceae bacterium]
MKAFLNFIFTVAVFLFIGNIGFGQQVTASSGGSYAGGSYSLNYTIGESVVETLIGSSILTQGFHQSKLTVTSIYEYRYLGAKINLYPNPTTSNLNIIIAANAKNYSVMVLNEFGKTLKVEKVWIGESPSVIDFNDFKPGVYFLRVIDKPGIVLQTFKVVKL